MPCEQQDIATDRVIAELAKWTPEETLVWLDYQNKRDKEEDERLDAEYRANGNRFKENNARDIWNRVGEEVARESERYIL